MAVLQLNSINKVFAGEFLLEDITFLNIKKRMLIMIINELEKLDFIKKPRNQNRRMLLRFTNKAVEYFKS